MTGTGDRISIGIDPSAGNIGVVVMAGQSFNPKILEKFTLRPKGKKTDPDPVQEFQKALQIRQRLVPLFVRYDPAVVVLEYPQKYVQQVKRKNGKRVPITKSVISLQRGYSWVEAAIIDWGYDEQRVVTPDPSKKEWRAVIARKHTARIKMEQMFPDMKFTEHECDAGMLALYGLRMR